MPTKKKADWNWKLEQEKDRVDEELRQLAKEDTKGENPSVFPPRNSARNIFIMAAVIVAIFIAGIPLVWYSSSSPITGAIIENLGTEEKGTISPADLANADLANVSSGQETEIDEKIIPSDLAVGHDSSSGASYTLLLPDGTKEETHYSAVAGQPVRWNRKIKIGSAKNISNFNLPTEARNISIMRKDEQGQPAPVTFSEVKDVSGGLGISSGNSSPENLHISLDAVTAGVVSEYEFIFITEAPQITEESLSPHRKKITISSSTHYENITTTSSLPQESLPEKITLLQTTNDTEELVHIVNYTDSNANGLIDQVTWIVPSLSNQTYELIIEIIKAQHLDENLTFISDIYPQVHELDGEWSEPIYDGDFIRVTFEKNLTSQNDITVYTRNNLSAEAKVEVYYFNSTTKIAELSISDEEGYYSTYLPGMEGTHDTFDLRILADATNNKEKYKFKDAFLEFDYIVDPVSAETVFVSNNEAHEVRFALLNESTGLFVMAWCDDTDDGAYFSVQYTNGTTYLAKTAIDAGAGDSCRIDVGALSSTTFVVAYLDWVSGASAWKTVGYDLANTTLFGPVTIDADMDSYSDVGVCALNSTDYVTIALDDLDNDATFAIYNGANLVVEQTDSDQTMAPDSGALGQDNVGCAVLAPNLFVFSYFDDNPDQIAFSIHNSLGQGLKNRTTVSASALDGATGLAALSTDGFVLAYCDSTDDDVSFTVFDNSGTAVTTEIDVNDSVSSCSGAGGTHIDVSALNTPDGQFAIIYDNTLVDQVYLAVYNSSGAQILAPQQIEATSDTVEKAVGVLGYEKNNNRSLCQFTDQPAFLVAYNDVTNGVWGTYWINGSLWDGNCADDPPEITAPLLTPSSPYSNDTLVASTTYTQADGNPGTVYFQWYVNGNNTHNGTFDSLPNGTGTISSLFPNCHKYGDIINVSAYASDGNTNSLLQWSNTVMIQSLIPKALENDGPEGTSLTQYNEDTIQDVQNFRWHRNGKGKIKWKSHLNLSNPNIGNDNNLDNDIEVGDGWLSINSNNAPVLNSQANITLENVNCFQCNENNLIYAPDFYLSLTELQSSGQSCSLSRKCNSFFCADAGNGVGNCTVEVTGFTGYAAGGNANLTINDSAEGMTAYTYTAVTYFAYYLNASGGTPITEASCNVSGSDSTDVMAWDAQYSAYGYTRTAGFTTSGIKSWNVTCSKSGFTTLFTNDTISIVLPKPTLLLPFPGASIINRTPTFIWNNSGGNTTVYNLLLDDNPTFNNPEINVSNISTSNPTNTSYSAETELEVDTTYFWKVRAFDGTAPSDYSATYNFTLQSYLAVSMLRNLVDFGEATHGTNQNTIAGNPLPFLAENSGNIVANVTITATPFFVLGDFLSDSYQFRIEENESGAFNASLSATNWTNMSNTSSLPHVFNLDWHYFKNNFQTGINLNIPETEPPGTKTSTVSFTIS